MIEALEELRLGVTSALPVGGLPLPLLLSIARHRPSFVEKTRYGQILLSERQDATARSR